jgi:hypothetical protein
MNLNDTSKELFAKIRGRFPSVTIGNEAAEVTNDPHAARFFDFDFKAGDKVLGKVSISISEQDGLVVIHSADLSQTEDLVARNNWFEFLKELRQFAKSRMMNFDTRDITKSNLEKRDYNFLSAMTKPKEVTEAALTGTNKTSFQNIGDSKLIIKHSAAVDADIAAGRTHRIHSIYVESSEGERFKYPFKHINGARAMARHVSEGGKPYDDFGKHIVSLSEELYKLRKFKNYVNRSAVMAETLKEYSTVINDRIEEIKETIQGLQKESFYRLTKENFKANETLTVPEDVKENWIDELTIKTFNDELQEVFPYIYKLVTQKPIKEITAEDFETEATGYQGSTETRNLKYNVNGDFDRSRPVSDKDAFTIQDLLKKSGIESEVTPDEGNYQGIVIYTNAAPQSVEKVLGNMIETSVSPIDQFEKILDSIIDEGENALFSSDSEEKKQALEKLNQLMSKHFPAGVNGVNGLESLEGIIDDANLNDQIREIGKKDSDACIRPLIYSYIQSKKPNMLNQIETGDMKMESSISEDEKNEVQQILNKHQNAFKQVQSGDDLYNHKELYSDLLDYFFTSGEMPYGTYKAREGDPINWITDRLISLGLIESTQTEGSIDDEYKFRDWLKKTHNKEVHQLTPQEYIIVSKQYRDEKGKKESYHPGEGSTEELAKEIWNNNPEYHNQYKDWQEFAKSEDFQFEVDRLKSKFENKKEDLHKASEKVEEFVKSFYDYTTNKFPKGETAVITAVQKQFGDSAAKTAIETIKTLQSGKDMEIERIKQLAGYSTKK